MGPTRWRSPKFWYIHSCNWKGRFDFSWSSNKTVPSRKLTYPTWGKGKSSSNMPYQGDMLVSWRVCLRGPNTFSRGIWMSSKPSNFLCRIPLKFMTPSSGLGGTNLTSLNLRLGTVSFWEKFVPQGKTTHGKNKTLEKWSPKKKTSYIAILSIIWSCYSWWVKWVDGQQNALHGTPCIKEFDKELIGFIGFSFSNVVLFFGLNPHLVAHLLITENNHQ